MTLINFSLTILMSLTTTPWSASDCSLTQSDAKYYVVIQGEKVELSTSASHPKLRSCRVSDDHKFLIVEVLQGLQGTQSLRSSVDLIVYRSEKDRWIENKMVSVGRAEKTKSGVEIQMNEFQISRKKDEITISVKN